MIEVEKYISTFPVEVQEILRKIRALVKKIATEATEGIAYGIPPYKTNGKPLVYFAAFKNHIGFFATPSVHKQFSEELSKYNQGKGSVQFPLNKPIPFDLIEKIIEFRVKENLLKLKK